MADKLRNKVASGVAWSVSEKIGSMLLQAVVSIVVARMLAPEDFGVMAIMTFFTALALVVVDSGFSQTLIRKEAPAQSDYTSVFAFNIAISLLLYCALTLAAPAVARFYALDIIADIAPVLFLLLPLNALCVIQNTIFIRGFRFDLISKINFAASAVSGLVAIGLAVGGCGVWALVGQRVSLMTVRALLLWILGGWRAEGGFSGKALIEMTPFSLRLLATDIISATYNNVATLFIGKMHSADTLGYFNQAQKLKDLPLTSAMQSVQSVTYPAMSQIGNDREKFAEGYRKVLMLTAFVMFPVMTGMIAVADDMFLLLLGERWMPTVPYFKILSLCGIFYPLAMVAFNTLKVGSNGKVIIRLEVVKKCIMTVILAATIPVSVTAVAWGLVAMSAIEALVNIAASTRYSALPWQSVVRTLLPVALLTVAMYAAVTLSAPLFGGWHVALRLVSGIAVGVAVYPLGALVSRMEAMRELRTTLMGLRHNK